MNKEFFKVKLPDFLVAFLILCAGIAGIYYVNISSRNILIMDYWRLANRLIPKVMDNELLLSDLFRCDWGQSNPLLNFLLVINIKHLGLNSMLSKYAAIIPMLINAIILYVILKGTINEEGKSKYCKTLFFFPLLLSIFNYNQTEILTQQFAFVFMFRLMSYLIIFMYVDYWLKYSDKLSKKRFVGSCILVICSICLWSQLYFFAMCVATLLVLLFDFLYRKRINKAKTFHRHIIWTLCVLTGISLYLLSVDISRSGGNGLSAFLQTIANGEAIYGCCLMLLAVILPNSQISGMSTEFVALFGLIAFIIIIFSLFVFFRHKLYKTTYFPLLLMLYGGGSILVIEYGRIFSGVQSLASSRYVCETTLLYAGTLMIFALDAYQNVRLEKYISYIALAGITICLVYSNIHEFGNAESKGQHYESAIIRAKEIARGAEISDSDVKLFQVNSTVELQRGIRYLHTFHLNAFSDEEYFKEMTSCKGISDDGWVSPDNQFTISTGASGEIIMSIYNPFFQELGNTYIFVYVDETQYGKYPVAQDMEIELSLEPEKEYTISFSCDYRPITTPPDVRELIFMLNNVFGM